MLDYNKLSHAYILAGAESKEKDTLILSMTQGYLCTSNLPPCGHCLDCERVASQIHPDVIWVGEEEKNLAIKDIREMNQDAYILPNQSKGKVYLLRNAHLMNHSAQNALLKLVEEGPSYASFLLLVEDSGLLLHTLRSRCQLIRVEAVTKYEADPESLEQSKKFAHLLLKQDELALLEYCFYLESFQRETFENLLQNTIQELSQHLAEGEVNIRIKAIELLRTLLATKPFHVGLGHIGGFLCAEMSKYHGGNP